MNKLRRTATWMLVIIGGFIVVLLGYAFTFYPAAYTLRILRWGNSDVYDYQKFPARALPASDEPFQFSFALQEEAVANLFATSATVEGDFEQFLADTGTQAFIVIRNDAVIYENYLNGASRESIVTSFSVAKSFASTLVGIAVADGYIQSIHDPITDYLPELEQRDPAFARITIRDLLMMSSGIRYKEFPFVNGDDVKTYYYPDLRDLALNQTEIDGSPGDAFLYNNYHPLLLGLILERATGMAVADYLAEKVWQPIGMAYDGSWSLDEHGFEKMESGINTRALDFAKFGRLFLREGDWDGKQVVSRAWVQEATSRDTTLSGTYYPEAFLESAPQRFYKYMWWGLVREGATDDYSAIGNYGQFIYISPHKDLIIVRHGEKYGIEYEEWLRLFYDFATDL